MKDKIIIFIIGLLVGAIITSAGFLAFRKNNHNMPQMQNGEPRQMTEMNNSDRMQRSDNSNNKSKLPSKENSSTNNTNS